MPWIYVFSYFNGDEIVGMFYEKNNKKQIQIKKSLKLKKDKEIGDKLYAKWKVCDNSFNSWIDKIEIR